MYNPYPSGSQSARKSRGTSPQTGGHHQRSQPLVLMDEDGLLPELHPESYAHRKAQTYACNIGTFDKALLYAGTTMQSFEQPSSGATMIPPLQSGPRGPAPPPFTIGGGRKRGSVTGATAFGPQTIRRDEAVEGTGERVTRRRSSLRHDADATESAGGFDVFLRGANPQVVAKIAQFVKDNPAASWGRVADLIDSHRKTVSHVAALGPVLDALNDRDDVLAATQLPDSPSMRSGHMNLPNASRLAEWERNTLVTVSLMDHLFGLLVSLVPSVKGSVEQVRTALLRAMLVEGDTFAGAIELPTYESMRTCNSLSALHRTTERFQVRLWCVDVVKRRIQKEKETALEQQKDSNAAIGRVVTVLKANVHNWRNECLRAHFRSWRTVRAKRLEEELTGKEIIRLRGEVERLKSSRLAAEEKARTLRSDASEASLEMDERHNVLARQVDTLKDQISLLNSENRNLMEQLRELKAGESTTPMAKLREELHACLVKLRDSQRSGKEVREHMLRMTDDLAITTKEKDDAVGSVSEHNLLCHRLRGKMTDRIRNQRNALTSIGRMLDEGDGSVAVATWLTRTAAGSMEQHALQYGLKRSLGRLGADDAQHQIHLKPINTFTEGAVALLDAEAAALHLLFPNRIQTHQLVDLIVSSDVNRKAQMVAEAAKQCLSVGFDGRIAQTGNQRGSLEWIDAEALEASNVYAHRLLCFHLMQHWLLSLFFELDGADDSLPQQFPDWVFASEGSGAFSPRAGTPRASSMDSPPNPSTARTQAQQVEFKTCARWSDSFRSDEALLTLWQKVAFSLTLAGAAMNGAADLATDDLLSSYLMESVSPKGGSRRRSFPPFGIVSSQPQNVKDAAALGTPTSNSGTNGADSFPGVGGGGVGTAVASKKPAEEKMLTEEPSTTGLLRLHFNSLAFAGPAKKASQEQINESVVSVLRDGEQYSSNLASIFRAYANLSTSSVHPTLVLTAQDFSKMLNDAGVTMRNSSKSVHRDHIRDVLSQLTSCRKQLIREAKTAVATPTTSSLQVTTGGGKATPLLAPLTTAQQPDQLYSVFEVALEELIPMLVRLAVHIQGTGDESSNLDAAGIFHRFLATQLCGIDSRVQWTDSTVLRKQMKATDCKRVVDALTKPLSVIFSSVLATQDLGKVGGTATMSQQHWAQFITDLKVIDDQAITFVAVNNIYLQAQSIEYNKPFLMCFSEFVRGLATLAWMKYPQPQVPLSIKLLKFYNVFVHPPYRKKLIYSMEAKSVEATGIATGVTPPGGRSLQGTPPVEPPIRRGSVKKGAGAIARRGSIKRTASVKKSDLSGSSKESRLEKSNSLLGAPEGPVMQEHTLAGLGSQKDPSREATGSDIGIIGVPVTEDFDEDSLVDT